MVQANTTQDIRLDGHADELEIRDKKDVQALLDRYDAFLFDVRIGRQWEPVCMLITDVYSATESSGISTIARKCWSVHRSPHLFWAKHTATQDPGRRRNDQFPEGHREEGQLCHE